MKFTVDTLSLSKDAKKLVTHVLSGHKEDGTHKLITLYDFAVNANPNVKKGLKALEEALDSANGAVTVDLLYEQNEKGFMNIVDIDFLNTPKSSTPKTQSAFTPKTFVSGDDRQASIERQNALTNATTLIGRLVQAGALGKGLLEPNSITELVKSAAARLLQFHTVDMNADF